MRREMFWMVWLLSALLAGPGCSLLKKRQSPYKPAARGQMPAPEDPPPKITPPPAPKDVPAQPVGRTEDSPVRKLANKAVEKEKELNTYIVRLRRREQASGKTEPMEVILLKYRRAPLSIHFKWLATKARAGKSST
jgi:hypothetical protein